MKNTIQTLTGCLMTTGEIQQENIKECSEDISNVLAGQRQKENPIKLRIRFK